MEQLWIKEQIKLKQQLITTDCVQWDIGDESCFDSSFNNSSSISLKKKKICFVGGVDISFVKDSITNEACASLVILSFPSLTVVYEKHQLVHLNQPYISGFLAFREVEPLEKLIKDLQRHHIDIMPDLLFVDGNGIFHPQGFGLACHLGVLLNLPTIGISKSFLSIDGLHRDDIKQNILMNNPLTLQGVSGQIWGMAWCSNDQVKNPIFISIGHLISLSTAFKIVKKCSMYRIPEPIRQADLRSRAFLFYSKNHLSSSS